MSTMRVWFRIDNDPNTYADQVRTTDSLDHAAQELAAKFGGESIDYYVGFDQ